MVGIASKPVTTVPFTVQYSAGFDFRINKSVVVVLNSAESCSTRTTPRYNYVSVGMRRFKCGPLGLEASVPSQKFAK
jgi:hypothetical protein